MNVYVVWYNNCEEYEDNYQDIEGIFETYDAAEKYLKAKNLVCIEKNKYFYDNSNNKYVLKPIKVWTYNYDDEYYGHSNPEWTVHNMRVLSEKDVENLQKK